MEILIIGHVCIDQNSSEHVLYTGPGSPAMFMTRVFQQLPRVHVTVISSYGPDFLPYAKRVSFYPKQPNCNKTLIYENHTKQGVRTQKAHNRDCAKPVEIDKTVVRLIKKADLIFFAPLLPNFLPSYFAKVVSYAKKDCHKMLLPQGFYRSFDSRDRVITREFKEADKVFPFLDAVVVSDQDHPQMFQEAQRWVQNNGILVIITKNKKGAVALKGNKTIRLPTRSVPASQIIDSVGAGDVFAAGFGYRFRQTKNIKKAGQFANRLARKKLFYTAATSNSHNLYRIHFGPIFSSSSR